MFNISIYLNKYSQIGQKEDQVKQAVLDAIKSVCNLSIEKENVKIESGTIKINAQGSKKSEIFINLEEVQEEIKINLEKNGHSLDKKKIL